MIWTVESRNDASAASTAAGAVLDAFVRRGEKDFGLALSGGRVAAVFFAELVRQSRNRGVELGGADYFWCDERCVPPDHADSNYRVARAVLLEPLGVVPERIHRLVGEAAPGEGEALAREDWRIWGERRLGRGRRPALDGAVLGVGEDGHVASLFPGNMSVDSGAVGKGAGGATFRAVRGPKPPPDRLTMGYGLLWEADLLVILATGSGKREVVTESLTGGLDTPLARVLKGRMDRETLLVTSH